MVVELVPAGPAARAVLAVEDAVVLLRAGRVGEEGVRDLVP